ncbi:MAG: ABC transporter substrate-binding protein [Actinomycetes bacterium]
MLVVAVVAMFAVGCGSKTTDTAGGGSADTTPNLVKTATGSPVAGGKLTFALEAETDGWDPTQNRWGASGTEVGLAIFDPLTAFDKDLVAQPYLAESLTPNSDFTVWDIKLRPNIMFHDGTPLNSAAIGKWMTAFKASPLTGAAFKPIASFEPVDDLTMRVTMVQPWSVFPSALTGQAGTVPAPAQLDNKASGSRTPIGTGPFLFKSWTPDKAFVATKNANYWRPGLPYLDEVTFTPIPDAGTRYSAVKAGDINITVSSAEKTIRKMLDDGKAGTFQVVRSTGATDATLVLLNLTKPPMNDSRVREAMAAAIDHVGLDAVTQTDPSLDATSVFANDSKWFSPNSGYPSYDLEKAKKLVSEYVAEKGPLKFTLGSVTDPDTLQAVQVLQSQFQAAGMQVEIQSLEQSTYILNAVQGNYQAQIWRQFGAIDPDTNFVWFNGSNASGPLALNMARNVDPVLDTALDRQRVSTDFVIRKQAWDTIQARQSIDLPYLWLSHVRWALAAGNNVRGLEGSLLPNGKIAAGFLGGVLPVTQIWFEN